MVKKLFLFFLLLLPTIALADSNTQKIDGMVFVMGGCFEMGDFHSHSRKNEITDAPLHIVCLSDFYIGKYEVTQKQWFEVMGTKPSFLKDCDDCPVDNVSWYDAKEYIGKLNKITDKEYRLPTEAEWEYAARSGGRKESWSGTNNKEKIEDYAWYLNMVGKKIYKHKPEKAIKKKVIRRKPNRLGLHDMTGTTGEWVEDWYDAGYYQVSPKNNPKGPQGIDKMPDMKKVLRGTSELDDPIYNPTYYRSPQRPDLHDSDYDPGFRLAISSK